jgi:predicted outer membrane protein
MQKTTEQEAAHLIELIQGGFMEAAVAIIENSKNRDVFLKLLIDERTKIGSQVLGLINNKNIDAAKPLILKRLPIKQTIRLLQKTNK